MQQENRGGYRLAAAECLEIAKSSAEGKVRERLTILAGKFLDLANATDNDAALNVLIDEFNHSQMRKPA